MNKFIKLLKNHKDYIILSILISLWLIVLGILSVYFANITDVLFQFLFHSISENIVLILVIKSLIIICIIILLIYLIFRNKKRFKFYSIANEQNLGENKLKAIVLPISLFRDYNQLKIEENEQEISIKFKDNFSFQIKNGENNDIDCVNNFFNEIKKFEKLKQNRLGFNWEVPLKIIYKIKKNQTNCPNCLKYIVLLGTEGQLNTNLLNNNAQNNNDVNSNNNNNNGNNGSYQQLDKLEKLIKIFFFNRSDNNDDIKIIKRKLNDFENFTELSEKFEEIEEDIKKEYYKEYKEHNDNIIKNYENFKGIDDTEIVYDITGGQKLVSVAGTFFSLKSQSPILYVSQNNNDTIKVINAIYKMEPPE